jgi:hypothetical protein
VQIVEQSISAEVMRILGQRQVWTVPGRLVVMMASTIVMVVHHRRSAILGMMLMVMITTATDVQIVDLLLDDLLVLFEVGGVETF